MPSARRSILHSAVVCTLFFAMCTILFGAGTTSTESGMAFPDWPTSDGRWLFGYPWSELLISTQAFYEHHHRELGTVTGLFTVITWILFVLWVKDERLKRLMHLVTIGVIVQGLLGMLTVMYKLEAAHYSIFHAALGQILVALLATLATLTSVRWQKVEEAGLRFKDKMFSAFPVVVIIQLVLGALYRHKGQVGYLVLHGLFAVIVLLCGFYVVTAVITRCKESQPMQKLMVMLAVLFCVQVTLGVMVVNQRAVEGNLSFEKVAVLGANRKVTVPHNRSATATAHVLVGAMILLVAASLRAHAIGPISDKNRGGNAS